MRAPRHRAVCTHRYRPPCVTQRVRAKGGGAAGLGGARAGARAEAVRRPEN